LCEKAARFIDRRALAIVVGFSCLYLAGTCGRASQKLFWHDELFTLYMARLPSMSHVWAAIATPADGTPPAFHAITRASIALFGDGAIGLRLPSIVGFLVACVSLYVFVRRRSGPVYGLIAFLLPMATNAYSYAYEARAYSVVLGLAGIALISWQAAVDGRKRLWSLGALFTSLSVAIACHYYASLLLVPFGIGEAARYRRRHVPDWPLWSILIASVFPLIALQPLIRAAPKLVVGWFSQLSPRAILDGYETVLVPLVIPALAILVLAGAVSTVAADRTETPPAPPVSEWLAMATLLATPMWAAPLAGLVVGSFVARYALIWVLGFSVLAAFGVAACLRYARVMGTVAGLILLLWTGAKQTAAVRLLAHDSPTADATYRHLLAERNTLLPIAVTHGHTYLPLVEYGPAEIRSRLVMIVPPPRVVARLGESGDTPLIGLSKWVPLRIQDLDSFIAARAQFLLYGPSSWILPELRAAGARLTYRGEDRQTGMFVTSDPGPAALYLVTFE
jgi:hypothetical protein